MAGLIFTSDRGFLYLSGCGIFLLGSTLAWFAGDEMVGFDRITIDPEMMNGQPCIRNMRITVRRVIEALAVYPDREDMRREYPELEEEDLRQALAYAAANLEDRVVDLPV